MSDFLKAGGYARDMTLRDYFAGQAMKYMGLPLKVSYGRVGTDSEWSLQEMEKFPYKDMATIAYKWADAMMEASHV